SIACCARPRVLKKRAAQSHLSSRKSDLSENAHRAADSGSAEAAVAVRVLAEILLVIVLGVIELRRRADLRGDETVALLFQRLLERFLRLERRLELLLAVGVDGRAVLRAGVVALAHALRRVVSFPEFLEQGLVAHLLRVEYDQHRLGVVGEPGADLLVARVRRVAAGVADSGRVDARRLPEHALRAPEAAHAELR